ncbi:MAG: hypothetical protein Q9160_005688 [Pyrenula sp. 1 TL-2023]
MDTNPDSIRQRRYHVSINHDYDDTAPEKELLSQLKAIPKDVEDLVIDEDVPFDSEWAALGDHFTSIRNIEVNAGYNEYLRDEKLPLHWPLERICFTSSCGEAFRSPWILEGRIKHLMLFLTSGLRFEGPTTLELLQANQEAIAQGKREKQTFEAHKGTPDQQEIEIMSVPDLVHEWISDKYAGKSQPEDSGTESHPKLPPMQLQKLEIIENDAIDTFIRFILANLSRDMENFTTLVLRSTTGLDFYQTAPQTFKQILPQLTQLRTLVLTVGKKTFPEEKSDKEQNRGSGVLSDHGREVGKAGTAEEIANTESSSEKRESDLLTNLYTYFPPNLQSLRFRGPASLVASRAWPRWVAAFSSSTFLPGLESLSFLLDLDVCENGSMVEKKIKTAKQEQIEMGALRKAKRGCEKVCEGARARGVEVQAFRDHWVGESWPDFKIDHRWEGL